MHKFIAVYILRVPALEACLWCIALLARFDHFILFYAFFFNHSLQSKRERSTSCKRSYFQASLHRGKTGKQTNKIKQGKKQKKVEAKQANKQKYIHMHTERWDY